MNPEIIKSAIGGDKEAFAKIYDEYSDRLFKFVLIKVNSRTQAEDILQETFVKAWRALPKFNVNGDGQKAAREFNGWMYRIAANSITDYFRKLYRKPETLELDDEISSPHTGWISENFDAKADAAALQNALGRLRPSYRQVLELRFIQDFTVKETAAILNKSSLAARLLQHRALAELKNILKADDYEYSKI